MTDNYPNAAFIRRFAAMLYDSFLLVALWMMTTTIIVAFFNNGDPVEGFWFQMLLYLEVLLFYFVFWRIKGQTLGMQVWKIRALDNEGNIMRPSQCVMRFLAATMSLALLGLGFLWILVNKDRLAWHDMLSDSHVVYLGPKPYESP
ncbi:MAG: RDD family protein [Pseudomonadales bacterium]